MKCEKLNVHIERYGCVSLWGNWGEKYNRGYFNIKPYDETFVAQIFYP
jgi:hypothetical protein